MKKFHLPEFDYEVEIGKFARQANGAVWLQKGGTVVLSTVVSSPSREFPGFLPLTSEYREQFSAAGKIPGGYYKREGKPSDKEVLTSRLIDRAIRPLFPVNFFDQLQVITTVYSVDKEHAPHNLGLLASSLAISLSNIPFAGPIGVVEVGRIDGEWVINPSYPQSKRSDVRLIVAGTYEGLCMVEGSSNGIEEKEFVDLLFKAHEEIKKLVKWQQEIVAQVGAPKEPVSDPYHWDTWQDAISRFITSDMVQKLYIPDKVERNTYIAELKERFITGHQRTLEEQEIPAKVIDYIFDLVLKQKITDLIFQRQERIDGRSFDQVRPISIDISVLPCTHGSALFTRGRTQSLVSLTLGGGQDEQRVEGIMEDEAKNLSFMLHYNFPPFSVGEVRPMRGPGRREVGHGHLAASALIPALPSREVFSYTIRLVSDILEADGSSSMATVCGSTMALMDGGVPIKEMIGGIAMGLLRNEKGDCIVLSDISGFEDAFGLMDFKVTGTDHKITAIQMDIKDHGGLSRQIFESALQQARRGRNHILDEMRKVLDKPKRELSTLVPRLVTFKIPSGKIGAVIGGGGKTIREIIETTGTNIDIESDGTVKILGGLEADLDKAVKWVKTLGGQIERGAIYKGPIRRIVDFGLFVELVPGQDGLVHVSNIPKSKQRSFARDYAVDEVVTVEVVEYDPSTERVRLRLLEE